MRHIGLEAIDYLKLFYISSRAYAKFKLDNGEVYKKVKKSVLFSLNSVYNVITKRGGHIENMQLRALCMDFAHPPIT